MIIAIDGPAASGKSTAARSLAKHGDHLPRHGRHVPRRDPRRPASGRGSDHAAACTVAEAIEISSTSRGGSGSAAPRGSRRCGPRRSTAGSARPLLGPARRSRFSAARRAGPGRGLGDLRSRGRGPDMTLWFLRCRPEGLPVASPRARPPPGGGGRPPRASGGVRGRPRPSGRLRQRPCGLAPRQVEGALRLETDDLTPEEVLQRLSRGRGPGARVPGVPGGRFPLWQPAPAALRPPKSCREAGNPPPDLPRGASRP